MNKKNNSNVWWTLLTGQGEGARTKSKVRNLASSLISVLFSLTILHYFANSDCLWWLWANESSIGKGKTDQKYRPGEQLQHNGNFTEATAAEINQDGVYVHLSERIVSIFFSNKNLTVLKSFMMLSRSSIMVLCLRRDLFPRVSLREDLHTHSTHCMQIILKTRFQFPHWVMKNVSFLKVKTIIQTYIPFLV